MVCVSTGLRQDKVVLDRWGRDGIVICLSPNVWVMADSGSVDRVLEDVWMEGREPGSRDARARARARRPVGVEEWRRGPRSASWKSMTAWSDAPE